MSRNSDAYRVISLAKEAGLDVERVKHGGYRVLDASGAVVTRIPNAGNGAPYWMKNALRAIRDANQERA